MLKLTIAAVLAAALAGVATLANAGYCTSTYNPYTKTWVHSCY